LNEVDVGADCVFELEFTFDVVWIVLTGEEGIGSG